MSKIERNSPCPCGSDLKYKKCCLNKESPVAFSKELPVALAKEMFNQIKGFMSYEEVNEMSISDIISKLDQIGIPFDGPNS